MKDRKIREEMKAKEFWSSEKCKPTDTRISRNSKHERLEDIYTQADHHQIPWT